MSSAVYSLPLPSVHVPVKRQPAFSFTAGTSSCASLLPGRMLAICTLPSAAAPASVPPAPGSKVTV